MWKKLWLKRINKLILTEKIENSDFQLEKKTIQLSILSLIMYGIISLLTGGPFAFFPINELVFFGVVSYFATSNFKQAKVSYLLFLIFAGLGLLKNQLFLGFFMTNLQITDFLNNPTVKYIPYLIFAFMLLEMLRFFFITKSNVFIFPVILSIFIFGTYINTYTFQVLSLLLFFIFVTYYFKTKKESDPSYSKSLYLLWFLILFLKLSTLFSMYLYDFEMDF